MHTLKVEIAGHGMELACQSQPGCERLMAVLQAFGTLGSGGPGRSAPTQSTGKIFDGAPCAPFKEQLAEIRQNGTRLLTYEQLQMTRLSGVSLYEQGPLVAFFDPAKNHLTAFVPAESLEIDPSLINLFWTFVLWEVLATHGRFLLHAACLRSPSGRVMLFPANSRQGKSSLSLALARSGYAFLADDLVCLLPDGSITALPRHLHVDPQLALHFPELAFLRREKAYFTLNPKRALARDKLSELYAPHGCKVLASVGRIDDVIFPKIQPVAHSQMERLPKAEALAELIPPSALIFVEETQAQYHLDRLKSIVEHAACFRLTLGRDLYEDPTRTVSVLESGFAATPQPGDVHASARL